jgi:Tc5 transposase DNA-binding domain
VCSNGPFFVRRPSKFPAIEEELVDWLAQVSEAHLHITDAMIRDKAKNVAKSLRISEDKFKASAGWIENFKNRHGVRKGQWFGDGKNTRVARALGHGRPRQVEDNEPAIAPSDSAFESRLEAVNERHYAAGVTYAVGDEDVQEPGSERRETGHSPTLRAIWQSEASTDGNLSITSIHSINRNEPTISQSVNTGRHHRHPSDSEMALDHIPPHHHHAHADAQTALHTKPDSYADPTYGSHIDGDHDAVYGGPIYQPLPPLSSSTMPTFSEAEDALNRVIMFIDAHPHNSILTTEGRVHLTEIKYALFQAGSGVPYSRDS